MRTLAPQTQSAPQLTHAKPEALRRTLSAKSFKQDSAVHAAHGARGDAARTAAGRIANFGHDLSRVPVSARPHAAGHALHASGEMEQGAPDETGLLVPVTGNGGTPAPSASRPAPPAPTPSQAPSSPAQSATPVLQKTQIGSIATVNNGGFSWACRWSIQNATASTNGWIVQHVLVTQNVTDSSGAAVTPGQGGYGGLRTSWYPLWEAWQVRGGSVFVGGSTTPHNADTYGQDVVGASTRGTTAITGRADFYPNLTLPASFTVRNAPPAWALPATNTNPNLTGGTGVLSHDLTATWNGVSGTGATTVTTV